MTTLRNLSMFDARQPLPQQPARPSRIIELLNAEAANRGTDTLEGVEGPQRLTPSVGRAAPGIFASTPSFPRDPLAARPPQRSMLLQASRAPALRQGPTSASRQITVRQPMSVARALQPVMDYAATFFHGLPASLARAAQVGLGLALAIPKLAVGPFLGALSGARHGLMVASFEADPDVGVVRGYDMVWFLPVAVGLNTAVGFKMGIRWGLDQVAAAVARPFGGSTH